MKKFSKEEKEQILKDAEVWAKIEFETEFEESYDYKIEKSKETGEAFSTFYCWDFEILNLSYILDEFGVTVEEIYAIMEDEESEEYTFYQKVLNKYENTLIEKLESYLEENGCEMIKRDLNNPQISYWKIPEIEEISIDK